MYSSCYCCQISIKMYFLERFSKIIQISNDVKIRPVWAELFHVERQTDRQTDKRVQGDRSGPACSSTPVHQPVRLGSMSVSRTELATSPWFVSIEGTKLHVSQLTANTFHHTLIPIKLPAVSFIFRANLLETFCPLAVRISLSGSSLSTWKFN